MPVTWLLLLNKSDVADLDYVCNLASYCTDREMGGEERTLFTIVVEETRGLFTFRPREREGGCWGRERERKRQTDRRTGRYTDTQREYFQQDCFIANLISSFRCTCFMLWQRTNQVLSPQDPLFRNL